MSYIVNKLHTDLVPEPSIIRWIAEKVLVIPPALITRYKGDLLGLIYRVFYSLGPSENKYITTLNGAKADLIVAKIRAPFIVFDDQPIHLFSTEPSGDLPYWILNQLLLFSDYEISVLCGIPQDEVEVSTYELIPLIKACYRILRRIKLSDPDYQAWHRARHILVRYFLDAEFHELN